MLSHVYYTVIVLVFACFSNKAWIVFRTFLSRRLISRGPVSFVQSKSERAKMSIQYGPHLLVIQSYLKKFHVIEGSRVQSQDLRSKLPKNTIRCLENIRYIGLIQQLYYIPHAGLSTLIGIRNVCSGWLSLFWIIISIK